jgi:hypothetical protein
VKEHSIGSELTVRYRKSKEKSRRAVQFVKSKDSKFDLSSSRFSLSGLQIDVDKRHCTKHPILLMISMLSFNG